MQKKKKKMLSSQRSNQRRLIGLILVAANNSGRVKSVFPWATREGRETEGAKLSRHLETERVSLLTRAEDGAVERFCEI